MHSSTKFIATVEYSFYAILYPFTSLILVCMATFGSSRQPDVWKNDYYHDFLNCCKTTMHNVVNPTTIETFETHTFSFVNLWISLRSVCNQAKICRWLHHQGSWISLARGNTSGTGLPRYTFMLWSVNQWSAYTNRFILCPNVWK